MSVSAVVPVWNGRALLERLFDSLERQTEPAGEVLAIDTGSTDGAPEWAARRGARVIPMGRNTGFALAVNRGIHESRGEWIAVLNNDVELAPDYFAALLAAVRAGGAWFATGKILKSGAGKTVDGTFDVVCRGGTAWRAGNGQTDGPVFSRERRIWSAPWTAALFRAELFQRVGLLDESFESYLEDVEFGLRCALAGCSGVYAPAAVAQHAGSAALGRWHGETVRRISRNQVWLVARYYPQRWLWPVLVAQALWGAVAMRHGAAIPWLRGKIEGLRSCRKVRQESRSEPRPEGAVIDGEHTIREMQSLTGFDLYWRMYFLLTGGGAK